jgi:hypothetical protein
MSMGGDQTLFASAAPREEGGLWYGQLVAVASAVMAEQDG